MRIERYSPRWQEEVVALADRVFGRGYFQKPSEIAREEGACMFVGVEDEDEDELAGFALGRVLPAGGFAGFLEHRLEDVPGDIEKADAEGGVGVIQTIAVAPEHRGKGVGSKLLRVVHDTVVGHGGDKLIATFKRGPREPYVDELMKKLQFEPWMRLPSYWQARCDQGSFACVHRDNGCTCEAVLYRKAVY